MLISDCCEEPDRDIEDGPYYSEINECPACGEHCEFIEDKEDECKH